MRVLITGGTGALARDLAAAFAGAPGRARHHVVAPGSDRLDVGDRDVVRAALAEVQPDAVVHTAAWTDVDGCEQHPDRAWRVNALGSRHVAEAAKLVGARICCISTDYVFDGEADRPYTEWDPTNPVSVYGTSKLAGEEEVRGILGADATVVRTSWLAGFHGKNFVKAILAAARQDSSAGNGMPVVDDQHGCPTFTDDLAGAVRDLVIDHRPGLFHVTNQGATTRYELARDALLAAGLDASRVRPVHTDELQPPRPARRPRYAVLDNAALRLSGVPLLPDHHEPLQRLVERLAAAPGGLAGAA